jgi:AraC family cel operon transcriptional repressor
MSTLRLADFTGRGEWFVSARHRHQQRLAATAEHDHGFSELFWIEEGAGWETIAGRRIALEEGSLRFVAPVDRHGFLAATRSDLHMVNVAFPSDSWLGLLARYAPDLPDWFTGPPETRHLRLAGPERAALARAGERLDAGPRTRLALETFLLQLVQIVVPLGPPALAAGPPAWLADAVVAMRDPRWFRRGPLAFARLCGRTQAHVSRAIRRCYGCTPTELTNQLRLDWAAARLTGGDEAITAIALDAGFPNLGHFYHCFSRRFATTPRRWRMRARQLTGG